MNLRSDIEAIRREQLAMFAIFHANYDPLYDRDVDWMYTSGIVEGLVWC